MNRFWAALSIPSARRNRTRKALALFAAGVAAGAGLYIGVDGFYVKLTATPPAAAVAPLVQLLPADMHLSLCKPVQLHLWSMPGLVQALQCTDPGLPNGQVYAFQMDSATNFQSAWRNFNEWWGFDASTAGTSCPPSGSVSQGATIWRSNYFPARVSQTLECETTVSGNTTQPAYAWTYPTEDAFIIAEGALNSSFSALNSWWTGNAAPIASPRPATP